MAFSEPARTAPRRIRLRRIRVAGVLVGLVAIAAAFGSQSRESLPSTASLLSTAASSIDREPLGEADGAVPGGVTIFDAEIPGVAKLDPALLGALRQAATAADGVEFLVDSGWRSPEYQEQLLRDAISEYGSEQEAARWVASPETSAHVSGDAVDLGRDAAAWLSGYGAAYGLCQIYGNEPWHYELRPEAVNHGCPPTYSDPTQDPRMQRRRATAP